MYEVQTATGEGPFRTISSQDDECTSPVEDEYNGWSEINFLGKRQQCARKIKFLLKEGHQDPWGMGVWIGIRQINVYGFEVRNKGNAAMPSEADLLKWLEERENETENETETETETVVLSRYAMVTSSVPKGCMNVVDGTGSEWYCKEKQGWIVIHLPSSCRITAVNIQWWGISVSRIYTILAASDEVRAFVEVASRASKFFYCPRRLI